MFMRLSGVIETPRSGPTTAPAPKWLQTLGRIVSTALLAVVGVALGLVLGKKIAADEWVLLVTASGLATYLVVALIDVRHALMMWLVTAPFARFVHLNIELGRGIPNLTLNRIMTGVLIVLVLAQLAIRRRQWVRLNWVDVFVVTFGCAAALSVPNAIVGLKSAAQSFLDLIGIPLAIYFIARYVVTSRQHMKAVMVSLVIIGCYLSILAIREQVTGQVWFYPEDRSVQYSASIRRVVGLLGNPAYIAVSIAMGVPWAWYLLLRARRGKFWLLAVIGTMMAGIYFCMNRSGWVGLAVSLLTMGIFVRRFRRIFVMLALLGAILASTYWALIVTSTTFQERVTAERPIEYRMEAWDVAFRIIKDNPVFGIGYENYSHVYKRYARWDIYLRATPTPHNTYLWVMLMGGAVAFVPFVLLIAAILISALTSLGRRGPEDDQPPENELAGVFLASMAAILVPALVMDILSGYYNTMIMFYIIGSFLGMAAGERRRQNAAARGIPPTRTASLAYERI